MAASSPSRSRGIPGYSTPPPNSAAIGRLPEAATVSTGQRLTKTSAPKGCCAERPLRVVARAVEDSRLPRATSADKGGGYSADEEGRVEFSLVLRVQSSLHSRTVGTRRPLSGRERFASFLYAELGPLRHEEAEYHMRRPFPLSASHAAFSCQLLPSKECLCLPSRSDDMAGMIILATMLLPLQGRHL